MMLLLCIGLDHVEPGRIAMAMLQQLGTLFDKGLL